MQDFISPSTKQLMYSMLTAIAFGGMLALSGIFTVNFFNDPTPVTSQALAVKIEATSTEPALLEEGEEDPTFVSRFSRVFIYSADNAREIIQSAQNSLKGSAESKISAPAYVVMDMDRSSIVLEKNPDTLLPIASLTKLVTAVIARKLLDQNTYITLTPAMLSTYGNEGHFRQGEKMRVKELMYPLLMVSSNDATEALAQTYGRKAFIKAMNDWVNSIGAYRTYFRDPSGLSKQNVSTARDLSIITQWILKNDPEIFDITLEKAKTVRTHTWINPTHFLNLTSYVGGKNGYTPEAQRTSIALFKLGKQERLYSAILLGSSARDNDILDILDEAVR